MAFDDLSMLIDKIRLLEAEESPAEEIVEEIVMNPEEALQAFISSLTESDAGVASFGPYKIYYEGEDHNFLVESEDEKLQRFVNKEGIALPSEYGYLNEGKVFYTIFTEDSDMRYAAEKTPVVNPYGGLKDRQFRGAINEMPDTSGPVGTQPGGWRTYEPKPAGELEESSPDTLEGSFTPDLVESKKWLCKLLAKGLKGKNPGTIYVLGSWYGNVGIFLKEAGIDFDRLVLVEPDKEALHKSEQLLTKIFDKKKLMFLDCKAEEVVYKKPGVVINTSCNETGPVFLTKLPDNMLCVLQARNNNEDTMFPTEHEEDFIDYFPLQKVYYTGKKELEDPEVNYVRYMMIGRSGKKLDETASTGQGGGSAGNGGGQMVGGPTTYEQENDMFKRRGPRRITAMTYEDTGAQTITLNQLYGDNKPDRYDAIWDYGTMIWDTPYEIQTINPRMLDMQLCAQYGVEHIEELFDRMGPDQHEIVDNYINDPNLSNKIIVLDDGHIVDGNHSALAAALTKRPIKFVDIGEEQDI
jgi:hypothetical protein